MDIKKLKEKLEKEKKEIMEQQEKFEKAYERLTKQASLVQQAYQVNKGRLSEIESIIESLKK